MRAKGEKHEGWARGPPGLLQREVSSQWALVGLREQARKVHPRQPPSKVLFVRSSLTWGLAIRACKSSTKPAPNLCQAARFGGTAQHGHQGKPINVAASKGVLVPRAEQEAARDGSRAGGREPCRPHATIRTPRSGGIARRASR